MWLAFIECEKKKWIACEQWPVKLIKIYKTIQLEKIELQ